MRDYGVVGQLGLEPTPGEYVAQMVQVFREVWRVLADTGTLWLNLGDSYCNNPGNGRGGETIDGRTPHRTGRDKTGSGLKAKDLIGIPWRVAFALQEDGWYLRSDIIWHKPNSMPESVADRPTKAHEYVFLLTKQSRYYYDAEAIKEPSVYPDDDRKARAALDQKRAPSEQVNGIRPRKQDGVGKRQHTGFNERWDNGGYYPTRNRRTVWTIPTEPVALAHFATYPRALVEPCIRAGTSQRGKCPVCGAQWERVTEREKEYKPGWALAGNPVNSVTTGWKPTCNHNADPIPCTVLDPFGGSGTTGIVARELGRNAVLCDLSLPYLRDIARERLGINALAAWKNGIQAGGGEYKDLPIFSQGEQ